VIVVATSNEHKLREIRDILNGGTGHRPVRTCQLSVIENGKTFEENAIKKAKAACKKTDQIAIADDSGLEVKCLNGKPGVKSARFAKPHLLCQKLLRVMKNCSDRSAQFVCVIAIAYPSGKIKIVKGICKGKIIHEMRGTNGFGYDPVFVPKGYKKTFAQMSATMKNRLSHRGKALRKLKSTLADAE